MRKLFLMTMAFILVLSSVILCSCGNDDDKCDSYLSDIVNPDLYSDIDLLSNIFLKVDANGSPSLDLVVYSTKIHEDFKLFLNDQNVEVAGDWKEYDITSELEDCTYNNFDIDKAYKEYCYKFEGKVSLDNYSFDIIENNLIRIRLQYSIENHQVTLLTPSVANLTSKESDNVYDCTWKIHNEQDHQCIEYCFSNDEKETFLYSEYLKSSIKKHQLMKKNVSDILDSYSLKSINVVNTNVKLSNNVLIMFSSISNNEINDDVKDSISFGTLKQFSD